MMETNHILSGRYKIIKPIGEGGMANVYLADDLQTKKQVAIKVLRMDLQSNDDTKRRFQREARASRKLNHPNIVKVFDIGEENGMSYIVMEYVVGMDLKHYIQKYFPIPYQKVIDIMSEILDAVQVAHDHDIIHRDLKPQNIMIDNHDHIKIMDFGIAVALHDNSLTQTNTLLGSVHYLSPEQAKGGMATKQSDIYALGIILYELLTGKVPFEGESAVSIAIKHFQSEIPSVQKFDPRIPQALENVVLHATAKNPKDRYLSAKEMKADIQTSLQKSRANEAKYLPALRDDLDETKIIDVPAKSDLTTPDKKQSRKLAFLKRKRFWLWAGILGLLVILITGIVIGSAKKDVTIPDLSGMSQTQAESTLGDNHLQVGDVAQQHDDNVQKNRVIKTIPNKGMVVKENSRVGLLISLGPKKIEVANYVGKNYTDVAKTLKKLGFTVRKTTVTSNDYAAGQITKQDVPDGKKVIPRDTIITFTVSTGEAVINMRDLTNYTQKSVQDYANENGLNVSFSSAYSDTVEKGLVISQSPSAGTPISREANIKVSLSLGKRPVKPATTTFSKTLTIPYNPVTTSSTSASTSSSTQSSSTSSSSLSSSAQSSGGVQENHVTIFIQDSTHNINTVYKQFPITQDTQVNLSFTVKQNESAYYRIVRDGELIMSDEVQAPQ
ncbi:Stk1 family PASTA domain-containing Ser/Thr kinase [Agrilactobacillus composti]|nr:Stk1 family PASTA domain-containing Ser/Thr kinase [Agrilactobacillus composti]